MNPEEKEVIDLTPPQLREKPEETLNLETHNEDGTERVIPAVDKDKDKEPELSPEELTYKEKFSQSTNEAQKLLDKIKDKDSEIERLRLLAGEIEEDEDDEEAKDVPEADEELFPGHKDLDDEAKENLATYTKNLTETVIKEVNKNPALAFAQRLQNETVFGNTLDEIIKNDFPDLAKEKDIFKSKYFNPNKPPTKAVLTDLAKIYLFDKARDLGAQEERKRNETRIDQERAGGGEPDATVTNRTMEDWERMARTDPAKFASLSKEYDEDVKNGKLAE